MIKRPPIPLFLIHLSMPLILLAGTFVFFELTNTDLKLQDQFFDFGTGRWWVDARDPWGRLFFYNGPKALVWIVGLTLLTLTAGPARLREKCSLDRRSLGLATLVIATVPALAGLGKSFIPVHCPSELTRYGGNENYVKLCSPSPEASVNEQHGGCFPAGHSSGGFAFLGLISIRTDKRWRQAVVALGLGLGWWMGGYQMLKGAHFLSHTLVTMFLAWIVVLLWRQVLGADSTSTTSVAQAQISP